MFTGIVEEMATVQAVDGGPEGCRVVLEAPRVAASLVIGASVAVNGTCLTAVEVVGTRFAVDAVAETLRRTNLGGLKAGSMVNLERPMPATGRFDGHVVQGHVDGTGTVEAITPEGVGARIRVSLPATLEPYLVEKGSITVDGVSLTVATLGSGWFEIALIPHTLQVTTLGRARPGDTVNLEVDILAKYVERLLTLRESLR